MLNQIKNSSAKNTDFNDNINNTDDTSPDEQIQTPLVSTFFKGALMGAADAVPGVSGGTIALIVGIYQRLITAISHFDFHFINLLCNIYHFGGCFLFCESYQKHEKN